MAEILHLPDPGERAWISYSSRLAVIAADNGYACDDTEVVLEELKPMFLEAFKQGQNPNASTEALNEWIFQFSLRLLIIAAKAKLELRAAAAY